MPILTTKSEGKGNGIRTVVQNLSDIARALSRPPVYISKFFSCELGAHATFDKKNDRYSVNGAHDAVRLRGLLDVFIAKFVLCEACKNPETGLVVLRSGKDAEVVRDCTACGARTGVDMQHKLAGFIVKNSPTKNKQGKNKTTGNTASSDPIDSVDPWRPCFTLG